LWAFLGFLSLNVVRFSMLFLFDPLDFFPSGRPAMDRGIDSDPLNWTGVNLSAEP
jgi:hypothetical protein